jgi:tetratricopeptide (TPR) repeat protein
MQAQKWDDAVAVYERARTELPEARLIQTNLVYCCQEWLGQSLQKDGEPATQRLAIALLKRFPQEKGVRDVVENHLHRVVYRLRDAGKYDEALATIDRQADLLSALGDAKLAQELAASVYDSSARTHMRDRKWEPAVAVYQNARTRLPESRSIQNNLVFCCQEWLSDSLQQDGEAATQKLAIALLKRFPQERGVRDVTKNHFRRLVLSLRDKGKFADALAVVDRHQELLSALDDKRAADEAVEAVYDGWARTFFDKDWPKAIEIYQMGLKRVPKSALLANNLKYCQQQAQK